MAKRTKTYLELVFFYLLFSCIIDFKLLIHGTPSSIAQILFWHIFEALLGSILFMLIAPPVFRFAARHWPRLARNRSGTR